ncbi:hypothetical protein ABBQ38_15536 [Trebouxia sp. C0009 RCD-2024]
MARFASEAELGTFLGRLDPDYFQFASTLWQNGVKTARQLVNATKPLLLSYGLPELYIDDIKAEANKTDTDADKDGGTKEGKPPPGFGYASCLLHCLLNKTTLTPCMLGVGATF